MRHFTRGRKQQRALAIAVACATALVAWAATGAPRIELSPARVVEGDPVSVRIRGLSPRATVTLHVQSVVLDEEGKEQPYYSEASFAADDHGTIDLATRAVVQ